MLRERLHALPWVIAMLIAVAYVLLLLWALLGSDLPTEQLTLVATGGPEPVAVPAGLPAVGKAAEGILIAAAVPQWVGLLTPLPKLLWGLAGAFVIHQMYLLTAAIARRDPFVTANSARLRRSGWALIAAESLSILASLAQDAYLRSQIGTGEWQLSAESERDPYIIIAGMLMLALARAFVSGQKLKKDAELTI